MTVKVTKPALNLREELAKGTQKYTQQQFWFDNLVTNGTFDTDTSGWTALSSASLSVNSGSLRVTNVGANYGKAYQQIATTAGKQYVVTFDNIGGTSSVAYFRIGSTAGGTDVLGQQTVSTVGDYTFTFTAGSATFLAFSHNNVDTEYRDWDNISVFEVDSNDDVIHTLPLGWKPLHVYEDGLIQREGDANDYTVVKTGDSYSVKPAVAPSASTQTCVIAELEL